MPSDVFPDPLWPRVIGQDRVKRILARALSSGRLPHALLFEGSDGVGKDAMAMELARVLHCEQGGVNPCGTCGSCVRLEHLQHPDVRLVTALPPGKSEDSDDDPLIRLAPEDIQAIQEEYRRKGEDPYHRISLARATVIKINSIREVRREAAMTTSAGGRRVFIISRAEMMNDEASNTILKTLEEPSGNTLLVLTSSHPDGLLPTIRSRCQRIRFDLLKEEEIAPALTARKGVPAERAALVARLAEGSYARACALLDEDLARERGEVVSFIRHAVAGNASGIAATAEERGGTKDREEPRRFLLLMLHWFRDALVLSRGGRVINIDQADDLGRFVNRFPHAHLIDIIGAVERSLFLLDRNVYIKLIFLHLAVRLKQLILPGGVDQGGSGQGTS